MLTIGRTFSQLAVATAFGLAGGRFVPMPVLVSLLAGLAGSLLVLERIQTPFARHLLNFGSSAARRTA